MGKENTQKAEHIAEIIEAEGADGNPCWYFALIKAELYEEYKLARDAGLVDIKLSDSGSLYVCLEGEKLGSIIDNGSGVPDEEAKDEFIQAYGVPAIKTKKDEDCKNEQDEEEIKGPSPAP